MRSPGRPRCAVPRRDPRTHPRKRPDGPERCERRRQDDARVPALAAERPAARRGQDPGEDEAMRYEEGPRRGEAVPEALDPPGDPVLVAPGVLQGAAAEGDLLRELHGAALHGAADEVDRRQPGQLPSLCTHAPRGGQPTRALLPTPASLLRSSVEGRLGGGGGAQSTRWLARCL